MRVELRLGGLLTVNGREIAMGRTFALLDAIGRTRSVQGAAKALSLSYRTAWARLAALEAAMGRPLVVKTKGHGTVLTPLGERLRSSLGQTLDGLDGPIRREGLALEQRLLALVGEGPAPVGLAVSHDPVLLQVLGGRDDVEVAVTGSRDALDRLLSGAAAIAGCHFGPAPAGAEPPLPRGRGLLAAPAFEREQGLIVAPGNPLALGTVADLARCRARYVNRQRGSGTRAWFDRLLAEAGLLPGDIAGYGLEEFTHHAVAAVVASGAADAGLGVRASADAFGLGFVPLGRETYWLVRRDGDAPPVWDEVLAELRAAACGDGARQEKGRPSGTGSRPHRPGRVRLRDRPAVPA